MSRGETPLRARTDFDQWWVPIGPKFARFKKLHVQVFGFRISGFFRASAFGLRILTCACLLSPAWPTLRQATYENDSLPSLPDDDSGVFYLGMLAASDLWIPPKPG